VWLDGAEVDCGEEREVEACGAGGPAGEVDYVLFVAC